VCTCSLSALAPVRRSSIRAVQFGCGMHSDHREHYSDSIQAVYIGLSTVGPASIWAIQFGYGIFRKNCISLHTGGLNDVTNNLTRAHDVSHLTYNSGCAHDESGRNVRFFKCLFVG
jgi:hypothetical protein